MSILLEDIVVLAKKTDYGTILYDYISAAYAKLTGREAYVGDAPDKRKSFCKEMYKWYKEKYEDKAEAEKSYRALQDLSPNKLADIALGSETAEENEQYNRGFTFGKIMGQVTFCEYLVNAAVCPQEMYLIHIAMAFKLTVEQLEELLYIYGYMPLHVKNPFHIAVYLVMKDMSGQEDYNQFKRVYKLFSRAVNMINHMTDEEKRRGRLKDEPMSADTDVPVETSLIKVFVQQNINTGNFAEYIARNRQVLNERHSRIIAEYRRLAKVVYGLYYNGTKDAGEGCEDYGRVWPKTTERYSLFSFINRFCTKVSQKHYKEYLFTNIIGKSTDDKVYELKHPSRELMLILWIYEYCFMCDDFEDRLICPKRVAFEYLENLEAFRARRAVKVPRGCEKGLYYLALHSFDGGSQAKIGEVAELANGLKKYKYMPDYELGCYEYISREEICLITDEHKRRLKLLGVADMGSFDSVAARYKGKRAFCDYLMNHRCEDLLFFELEIKKMFESKHSTAVKWNGAELRAWLNSKLQSLDWPVLNGNISFDATIMSLCDNVDYRDGAYCYDKRPLKIKFVGSVPRSLQVMVCVLGAMDKKYRRQNTHAAKKKGQYLLNSRCHEESFIGK